MKQHVAIVGGGITGLTTAYRLNRIRPASDILLIEERSRLGGNIVTERIDDFVVEGAADCFLSRKPRGIGLCEELGIAERLIGRRPENARTYVRIDGKLHPLPEGLTGLVPTDFTALRSSTLLTESGRKRLEEETRIGAATRDEDESIADFMIRRIGLEAYERVVEPLLSGIYGGDGRLLSLAATFPQLREIEREHGSLIEGLQKQRVCDNRYPAFASFPGGMTELVEALESRVPDVHRICGARVVSLSRNDSMYRLVLSDGDTVDTDAVVLATPAFVTAELVESIDPDMAAGLRSIPYGSCATVSLAYKTPLDVPASYGYLVPRIENSDVLACTITSNKWERRAPANQTLVRVYLGRVGRDDITSESDDSLVRRAREELRSTLGIDPESDLRWVFRWQKSMPQYTIGHLDRVETIERALGGIDGLFVAGAAYRGAGIPDCIESAENAAAMCATHLDTLGSEGRTLRR